MQARDGRQATFYRRKGRKEDLFDDHDQPQPESAIAAFLAGATRERFEHVFGLNGAALRRGGDEILQRRGEAGEAILGAHTGLHGFRAKVEALEAEAGKLFGDRRGRRAFHEAADRFTQARQAVAERRIEPAAWKQTRDDLTTLEQARTKAALQATALHGERSRLDRIRRTTSARLALSRALEDIEALGSVPDLPADAADRYRGAVAARDQALRDLAREQARLEALDADLVQRPESPPILALGEAIDALAEHRKHVAIAMRDRETQRLLAAQRAAAMVEEGHRLGLDLDADALAARVPNALDRENVNKALQRHARLSGQQTATAESLAGADARLVDAKTALDALPVAEPAADLRQAIDALKALGPLDDQLAEAASAVGAAKDDLATALAALPLWDRGAEALAAAPMPLDADILRLTEVLAAARENLRTIDTRLAEHDRLLDEFAAQARADAAAGDLPTTEAIGAVRARRDAAWALIRRSHVDGGAAVSPEEAAALGLPTDLPDAFPGLIETADRLADRRAAEQERVVAVEQRRAAAIRQQALRQADAQRRTEAALCLSDAQAAWRTLWQSSGILPQANPLPCGNGCTSGPRSWPSTGACWRRNAGWSPCKPSTRRLWTLWPRYFRPPPQTGWRYGWWLPNGSAASGKSRPNDWQKPATRWSGRPMKRPRRRAPLPVWKPIWRCGATVGPQPPRALSLPSDASPDLGTTALGLWEAIDKAARQRRAATDRVGEMTASIDRFAADTRRGGRTHRPWPGRRSPAGGGGQPRRGTWRWRVTAPGGGRR